MTERTEKDALGELKVDSEAYWGIFTERARKNFQISGIKPRKSFIKALATIKKCSAAANRKLGVLDEKVALAIESSAQEVIDGKHEDSFPLEVFQAGAGTPFNMNMNEVIANLVIEKLGGKKGEYSIVHPNNHVNMAQSSNDVIPTAIRIAAIIEIEELKKELELLAAAFQKQAEKNSKSLKVGRTHYQDAVPISFGQELGSYATSIKKCRDRIINCCQELHELGIGGTAIGTGITTHPEFKKTVIAELIKETGFELRIADDTIETTWSEAPFTQASSSLRTAAIEIAKICEDLMLLGSGPNAGISELTLPEVEPGSSIMPGKINPSITECMRMICFQIIGNDTAIMEGSRSGSLELNVNTPLILHNLTSSAALMTKAVKMLREDCIDGIQVNETKAKQLLEKSHVNATALNPYLGYEVMAEIVKLSLKQHCTIKEIILQHGLLNKEELDKILAHEKTLQPALIDKELASKIKTSSSYLSFKKSIGK